MAVNAAPSGKAPPGRLRFGAVTMAPAFLTGTQFMPENVAIAHHTIVDAVPPGGATAVRKQDAKTPGLGTRRSHGYRTTQTPEERLT